MFKKTLIVIAFVGALLVTTSTKAPYISAGSDAQAVCCYGDPPRCSENTYPVCLTASGVGCYWTCKER